MVSTSIKGLLKQGFRDIGLQVQRLPRMVKPFTYAFSEIYHLTKDLAGRGFMLHGLYYLHAGKKGKSPRGDGIFLAERSLSSA